jgi:urease accessory protein
MDPRPDRRAMKAEAHIVAEPDGYGGTRAAVLRGESPLLLRRTGPRGGDLTVHLVGGAAGPLRGDDLRLHVEATPAVRLDVRSVAATLALPGRPGPASRLTIRATVAAGATLRWWPEPLIAAAGCDHHTVTEIDVAEGGTLIWRDDLVLGRHGEDSGDVRTTTTIRYAGATLHRHDLSAGPAAPGWAGPAVLGGGRAFGTLVIAGPDRPPAGRLDGGAVMPLAGPGVVATAVAADIRDIRRALDPLTAPASRTPARI